MQTTILILTLISGSGNVFIKEIELITNEDCNKAGVKWKADLDKNLHNNTALTSFVCVDKNYK